jgi:5-methylcytosine-specific restriction endonuclease McrA
MMNSKANGIRKHILELDIEKCFDRIDQNDLMTRVTAPQSIKLGLWRCLKAGINVEYPNQGTPQGGIISPLLANVSLDGIERIGEYVKSNSRKTRKGKRFESGADRKGISIRYADDMVFFLDEDEDAEELAEKAFPSVSWAANRFDKVKGDKSPFDGDIHYWSERNSKLYDGLTVKLLKKQGHKCGHCGQKFLSEERVHVHHVDGNHDNWRIANLTVVHESCHDYIHM